MENTKFRRKRACSSGAGLVFVCGLEKILNRTLAIDSPFKKFAVD